MAETGARSDPEASHRGRKRLFSRDDFVAAAIRLIDSESPDEFTMRRLATELGAGPTTLYGYFSDKHELLEAVAEQLFADAIAIDDPTEPWDERLRTVVRTIYDVCRRHPHIPLVIRRENVVIPSFAHARENMLRAMRDGGLDTPTSIRMLGILNSYAEGFAATAAHSHQSQLVSRRAPELAGDEYPLLRAAAPELSQAFSRDAFEQGLDLLLPDLRQTGALGLAGHAERSRTRADR